MISHFLTKLTNFFYNSKTNKNNRWNLNKTKYLFQFSIPTLYDFNVLSLYIIYRNEKNFDLFFTFPINFNKKY